MHLPSPSQRIHQSQKADYSSLEKAQTPILTLSRKCWSYHGCSIARRSRGNQFSLMLYITEKESIPLDTADIHHILTRLEA